jgi:hypothetical protein
LIGKGQTVLERAMNKRLAKIVIATTTFTCATLFSLDWSAPGGISLATDHAQARVGRPLTPVSVAGVARRQNRRAGYGYGGYGYGAGVVGAGLAVGAATVAAATSPWGYGYGQQPYGYHPAAYYANDPNAAYASANQGWAGGYAGGFYASSPWGYYDCHPVSSPYECQPYSHAWQDVHY